MGKLSRTKGLQFEQEIARQWQELGWTDARRQLEYHIKDALGVDLQDTEPFAVQCKRGRTYAPITAIEEIKKVVICQPRKPDGFARRVDERECVICGRLPEDHPEAVKLLITKADRKPTMAVLPWDELKRLIRMAYKE